MSDRLFLAAPVRLYDYENLRASFSPLLQGRWRDEKTLHATVAFLGSQFDADTLIERLEGFDCSFTPSSFDRFGYFSNSRVFVALSDNSSFQQLRNRLATTLALTHESLRPHVTLMRVKSMFNDPFESLLKTPPSSPLGVMEPCIALYRSTLLPEGAQYTIIREWRL